MEPSAPFKITPLADAGVAQPFKITPVSGEAQPWVGPDTETTQKQEVFDQEKLPNFLPKEPGKLMAVGLAKSINDAELWMRERPDPDTYSRISGPPPGGYPSISAGDPQAQMRISELKGNYRMAGQVIGEAQQDDSYPAKLVGNAMVSAPSSLAGTLPFLLNAPTGVAMAGSLLWNYVNEASSDYANRTLVLGQERNAAYADATRHGLVATGLEAGPMAALGGLAKGTMTLKNAAPRFLAGEA